MKPIVITATVRAWLTGTRSSLDEIVKESDPAEAISRLGFSAYDMDEGSYPWVHIGSADITVTLMPQTELVAAQVEVLNKELQRERAESQGRQNAILDRISKLSALTFDGAEDA